MTHLPLEGVRILDLAVVWAGPFATVILADLGAEVLKAENPFVWQPVTRGQMARPLREVIQHPLAPAMAAGYPHRDPGPRPWNYNPGFVSAYRNKYSFSVDYRRPEGRAILERVIALSDVVVENNATDLMEELHLTYDDLRRIRPDIIMLRAPAYGSTGEYAYARAFGAHLESVMGHTLLRGYADGDPSYVPAIYSGDFTAGVQIAFAVMAALWHRENTGEGQLVEVAQAENASPMLAQAFMDYVLNDRVQTPIGNRSIEGYAPQGVYPCHSDGGVEQSLDRWIAISITSDDEWAALRAVLGQPDWAADPALDHVEGRRARQDVIDARLAAWTADQDDYALFHRLQAAGVPAAPVLEASRLLSDPHIQARGLYQPQTLFDQVGTFRYAAPFLHFSATPLTVRKPAVAMGEDNDYVYRQLLGLSDAEYAALRDAGHITMDFDPSLP